MKTKADFRALREELGLSMHDIAAAVDVQERTVRRWESPHEEWEPPEDAWEYLDEVAKQSRQVIDYAIETAEAARAETELMPNVVALTYFRSQNHYDEFGRDSSPFGAANANARAVARELRKRGFVVEFRYPEEGAIKTPGSNY